jgi:renalase
VRDDLLHDLANVLATPLPEPRVMALHRWRFAKAEPPLDTTYFLDAGRQLAACGDGFTESRVEGAFLSANALADALVQRL